VLADQPHAEASRAILRSLTRAASGGSEWIRDATLSAIPPTQKLPTRYGLQKIDDLIYEVLT